MIWLWRKDSNLRMAALTVRCLTSLATPQENCYGTASGSERIIDSALVVTSARYRLRFCNNWLRRRDSNSHHLVYKTSALLSN